MQSYPTKPGQRACLIPPEDGAFATCKDREQYAGTAGDAGGSATNSATRLARLESALWDLHAKRGQYDARPLVDQIVADVTALVAALDQMTRNRDYVAGLAEQYLAEADRMREPGRKLATLCYNLATGSGRLLPQTQREMRALADAWDAAMDAHTETINNARRVA